MAIINTNPSLLEEVDARMQAFDHLTAACKAKVDDRSKRDYDVLYKQLQANVLEAIEKGLITRPGNATVAVSFDGNRRQGATVSATISTQLQDKLNNTTEDLNKDEMDELLKYLMEHPIDARLTATPIQPDQELDFDDFED